ncbi:MAG: hypothetical protein MUF43_14580 [Flavobacterium sp.]|nr:hypothetical protein [Flavobacterium sp.]
MTSQSRKRKLEFDLLLVFIHASKFATVIASATNFSDALYKLSNESPDNHHSDVFELKSNYNKVCLTVMSTLKNASDINNKEFFSKGIEKVVFDSFANDQSLMVMRYINKSSYNRFYVYYKSYTDTHTFNSDFEHLPENVNNWFNNNEFHYLEFTRKQYEEATK